MNTHLKGFICKKFIPQTTGVSFTFNLAGSYRVCALKGGCDFFSNTVVALGVTNLQAAQNILLYPNPIKDELTMSGFSFQKGDEVKITDVTGKEVYKTTLNDFTSTLKVNTSFLKEGTYLIEITSKDKKVNQKLIKAN